MKDQDKPEKADFKIATDGTWHHNDAPIKREELIQLFSSRALKVDEKGCYWLQTPYEKYPVDVEDVPYVVTDYVFGTGGFDMTTNLDEKIEIGPDNPIILKKHKQTGEMLPYVEVRDGLHARLGRSVYYNLIEEFGDTLYSRGGEFKLGQSDEDTENE